MKKIILFLLTIILCSCEHKIDCGIIIEKKYYPSHTQMQPMIFGKVTMVMPVKIQARYSFIVRDDTIIEEFNIEKSVYDKYNIGDSIYFKN